MSRLLQYRTYSAPSSIAQPALFKEFKVSAQSGWSAPSPRHIPSRGLEPSQKPTHRKTGHVQSVVACAESHNQWAMPMFYLWLAGSTG